MKYKVTNNNTAHVVLNDENRTSLAPGETKTVEGENIDFLGMKFEEVKSKKIKEVEE